MLGSMQMYLYQVTAPSRDCGMHLGNKYYTAQVGVSRSEFFLEKQDVENPGGDAGL